MVNELWSSARTVTARVACFTLLAYGWSWLFWFGEQAYRRGWTDFPVPPTPLAFFGPSLAAVCVALTFDGSKGGTTLVRRLLQWRLSWYVYALALLTPPLIKLVAALVGISLGECCPRPGSMPSANWLVTEFSKTLMVGGPLGEELGWRGYLLPVLAPLGARRASILVGVLWFGWHLPAFWMPGSAQTATSVAGYGVSLVAGSVAMAWLFGQGRGSVLPCILCHTSVNFSFVLTGALWPGISYSPGFQATEDTLTVALAGGIFVVSHLFRTKEALVEAVSIR
jgi:CAAX protease family protein